MQTLSLNELKHKANEIESPGKSQISKLHEEPLITLSNYNTLKNNLLYGKGGNKDKE